MHKNLDWTGILHLPVMECIYYRHERKGTRLLFLFNGFWQKVTVKSISKMCYWKCTSGASTHCFIHASLVGRAWLLLYPGILRLLGCCAGILSYSTWLLRYSTLRLIDGNLLHTLYVVINRLMPMIRVIKSSNIHTSRIPQCINGNHTWITPSFFLYCVLFHLLWLR